MLMPKRVKFRKAQRGKRRGVSKGATDVHFGEYGLKALECGWITNRNIESARIAITRNLAKGGKLWIRIFPDKPVSQKAAESRMGRGKGNPEFWVAVVKPGRVMFEVGGTTEMMAREALGLAAHKMPILTKFVTQRPSFGG